MTTILWHNGRLFADTLVVKGRDRFHSLTKIVKLSSPIDLKSKLQPELNGRYYGWACTGTVEAAAAFMVSLQHMACDSTMTFYETTRRAKLGNASNCFTILIIGQKQNIIVEYDANLFEIRASTHDTSSSIGSGNELVMEKLKEGADPVRAFLHAFYTQPEYTGGNIDVWALYPQGKGLFQRMGVYDQVPVKLLPLLIAPAHMAEQLPMDLVTPPVSCFPYAMTQQDRPAEPTQPKRAPARKTTRKTK